LNNRYYALRHGRSEANEAGIIISNPEEGTRCWGLTDQGRRQVGEGISHCGLGKDTLLVSSDFLRTWETALLAAELLACPAPKKDARLRERFFGDYDGRENTHYNLVWDEDLKDSYNKKAGVESPTEVQARFSAVVKELEESYIDRDIVLVSHGDALQIGQTWFEGCDVREHRSLDHLKTGEVRLLGK
jgi:glucosyl-3-phosphoglycerate phosphatase